MTRLISVLLLLLIPSAIRAENPADLAECEILIDDFAKGIKPGWSRKSFKGETQYVWMQENGKGFIRAESKGAASGLYYEIGYDPQQYPFITWQWKVDDIIAGGDATKKSFDDYGARVFVIFPGYFFWNTKTINYIWANKLPKDEAVPSPYTANDIMISVESGATENGKWLTETRNVYEDYKHFFGKEPPEVGAIAIMTDTDNTGESGTANYGPIAVCSRDPRK